MTRTKLMSLLPLSALLSACTVEVGRAGTILLLVLLPAALVFALLWGLRTRRQSRRGGKEDRRNYPDFDDRE
jgi:hypothetical protein